MLPTIFEGSILDVEADCIVNPANSFLRHDGGLAAVIAQAAAGPEADTFNRFRPNETHYAWQREQAHHPLIPTGGAGWTSAGALPYRGIVHAVGPIWGGGRYYERDLLRKACYNALVVAAEHGCKRVAMPAISCGVFGFPVEQAARIAVVEALQQPSIHVTFALMGDEHVHAFREAFDYYGVA